MVCSVDFLEHFLWFPLFISLYLSFTLADPEVCLCLSLIGFRIHHSFNVTSFPLGFLLFYSAENKLLLVVPIQSLL
jgi:hypothetical protein